MEIEEGEGREDGRCQKEEERAAGLSDVPGAHSEKAPQTHVINNASPRAHGEEILDLTHRQKRP